VDGWRGGGAARRGRAEVEAGRALEASRAPTAGDALETGGAAEAGAVEARWMRLSESEKWPSAVEVGRPRFERPENLLTARPDGCGASDARSASLPF